MHISQCDVAGSQAEWPVFCEDSLASNIQVVKNDELHNGFRYGFDPIQLCRWSLFNLTRRARLD